MRSILHQAGKVRGLSADELAAYFEDWADPNDEELRLVHEWRVSADRRELRRARAEVDRRMRILLGLRERLNEDGRRTVRRYLGCTLIRQLIRQGDLGVTPYDDALIHNDSIDFRFGQTVWVPVRSRALRAATATARDFEETHHRVAISHDRPYILSPGQVVNIEMLENVRLSKHYGMELENTSRWARLQVVVVLASRLHAGHRHDGHDGGVMLEVQNRGVSPREIFPGDVAIQGFLYEVEGACSEHRPNKMPFPDLRPETVGDTITAVAG